jgi:hypothetical protein
VSASPAPQDGGPAVPTWSWDAADPDAFPVADLAQGTPSGGVSDAGAAPVAGRWGYLTTDALRFRDHPAVGSFAASVPGSGSADGATDPGVSDYLSALALLSAGSANLSGTTAGSVDWVLPVFADHFVNPSGPSLPPWAGLANFGGERHSAWAPDGPAPFTPLPSADLVGGFRPTPVFVLEFDSPAALRGPDNGGWFPGSGYAHGWFHDFHGGGYELLPTGRSDVPTDSVGNGGGAANLGSYSLTGGDRVLALALTRLAADPLPAPVALASLTATVGPASVREELTTARSSKAEPGPARTGADATLVVRPDVVFDPAPGKEGGHAGSGVPAVAPLTPVVALADPPAAALPGAAAADADRHGAIPFVFYAPAQPASAGRVVVWAGAEGSGGGPSTAPELTSVALAPAAVEALKPAAPAGLVEAGLPAELPVLKAEVDAFLARLAALGEAGNDAPSWARLGPWLALLSAAAVELLRRWEKKNALQPLAGDDVLLGALGLPPERER